MRKNCSSDREKHLKFEAEGRDFSKILGSLEQFMIFNCKAVLQVCLSVIMSITYENFEPNQARPAKAEQFWIRFESCLQFEFQLFQFIRYEKPLRTS